MRARRRTGATGFVTQGLDGKAVLVVTVLRFRRVTRQTPALTRLQTMAHAVRFANAQHTLQSCRTHSAHRRVNGKSKKYRGSDPFVVRQAHHERT